MILLNDQLQSHLNSDSDNIDAQGDNDTFKQNSLKSIHVDGDEVNEKSTNSRCTLLQGQKESFNLLIHGDVVLTLVTNSILLLYFIWSATKSKEFVQKEQLSITITLIIVSMSVTIFSKFHFNMSQKVSSNDHITEYRNIIIESLGSIQAPSLSHEKHLNSNSIRVAKLFVKLTNAHVLLFEEIENSIGVMKTITSVRYGLGPNSASFARIENKYAKCNSTLFFNKMSKCNGRRIILQHIREHHDSLQKIRSCINSSLDIPISDVFREAPITISSLNFLANKNKELLSSLISNGLSDDNIDIDALEASISSSILFANEAKLYLSTYFNLDALQTISINSTKVSCVYQVMDIQNQLHVSQYILWAITKELQSQDMKTFPNEALSLWKDFKSCFQHIYQVYTFLDDNLFATNEENNNTEATVSEATMKTHPDVGDFQDEGKSLNQASFKATEDPKYINKTLVFSGQGTKHRKQQQSVPMTNLPALYQETTGRMMLIQELTTRLKTVEIPDEVEKHTDTEKNLVPSDFTRTINQTATKTSETSTNFFMGVSGNMLKELKDKMVEQEEDVIGDG
ncbi:predicted protein [Chaetoceros tenuissimus]|uniref:Uncharacterized protein n=1 Tax=Chaetoceros tenuissimus TaxID=426638 RepID=A0AAD3DCV6_9STRA|nr:predicted protein [Chaetoceros tenuissimus]